ncbi:MAG: TonB-dependent receptor [Paludibacteraceae bacterium]|nr:TonB-dependent receptor [Paludibacteraceae bacterium]
MRRYVCILFVLSVGYIVGFAQRIKVEGLVEDVSGGVPIIGATIIEKGTGNGTVSDMDGRFELFVSGESVLEVSYMGYIPRSIKVNGRRSLKIGLEEDSKQLEEVVVVGYGTMKKRDITGAISSIGEEQLMGNKPASIAVALQGKVSGLEIVTSSEPGSASDFRIRGASTLNSEGSTPLFIVDGMEVANIDNISPSDIASIEVLKDAASTAIYGSKSANGVIIVSTKQGASSKPVINVGYSLKVSQLGRKLPQMNRRECIDFDILRSYLDGLSSNSVYVNDSLNPSFSHDYYYQDELFRTGLMHQADFSIAGKSDKFNYFSSLSYMHDDGIAKNTWNRRGTGRLNLDYKPHERVTIASRISISLGANRQTPSGARSRILERPANMAMVFDDGTYAPVIASRANPLAWTELCINNTQYYELNVNEFVEWHIIKDLTFKASLSGTFTQSNYRYFEPAILNTNQIAASSNKNTTSLRWTHEDVVSYNHTWENAHTFTAMVGFSIQGYTSEYINLKVSDNISESIETSYAFNNVDLNATYHYRTENRMASFFARVGYAYKGRYLLNANVRADGSSRFGSDKKWGVFPSVSVGWRLSDEPWMHWAKPSLSDLKIRYSYGMTGNQTAGDYAALAQYSTIAYGDYVGIYATQLENNELGWESTSQHNLGVDISLFNSRLGMVFDIYSKETRDILFSMKLPGTSGFSSSYTNVGSISNKGLEFSISGHIIKHRDFDWTLGINFAFNRNKLFDIPQENVSIQNDLYIIDNGYTLGTMYGYKALQIFSYNESNAFTEDWRQLTPVFDEKDRFLRYELDGEEYGGVVRQLHYGTEKGELFRGGDVMWDDVNHDGVINADDRQVIGCGQPDFTGGLNTEFRWKGLHIGAFFQFSVGGDVINVYEANRNAHVYGTLTQASPVYLAQSWLAPGDIAKYPIPSSSRAVVQNTRLNSSLWIEDGSYIRLKNLKISYSLPRKWVSKMRMQDWTFAVMLQDFFTWTNYDGFDPEEKSYGFAIGYDSNSYPRSKSVLCSMNITF